MAEIPEGITSKNEQNQEVAVDEPQQPSSTAPPVVEPIKTSPLETKPPPDPGQKLTELFAEKATPSASDPQAKVEQTQQVDPVQAEPKLYGTGETLNALSEEAKKILMESTQPKTGVLVTAGGDLSSEEISMDSDFTHKAAEAMREHLKQHPGAAEAIGEERFNDDEYMSARYLNSRYPDGLGVSAFGWDFETGQPDLVWVTMEHRPDHENVMDLVIDNANESLTADMLTNISMSSEEEINKWLLHEMAHVQETSELIKNGTIKNEEDLKEIDSSYDEILGQEVYADLKAFNSDKISDRVADDSLDIRALETLRAGADANQYIPFSITAQDHSTNVMISPVEEGELKVGDDQNVIKDGFNASAEGTEIRYQQNDFTQHNVRMGVGYVNSMTYLALGERNSEKVSEVLEAANNGEYADQIKKEYGEGEELTINVTLKVGEATAMQDPLLHYATVKTLYDKGYFAQGSAEEEVAKDFIKAAEEHFVGVDSEQTQQYLQEMNNKIGEASDDLREKWSKIYNQEGTDVSYDKTQDMLKTADNLMKPQ